MSCRYIFFGTRGSIPQPAFGVLRTIIPAHLSPGSIPYNISHVYLYSLYIYTVLVLRTSITWDRFWMAGEAELSMEISSSVDGLLSMLYAHTGFLQLMS